MGEVIGNRVQKKEAYKHLEYKDLENFVESMVHFTSKDVFRKEQVMYLNFG